MSEVCFWATRFPGGVWPAPGSPQPAWATICCPAIFPGEGACVGGDPGVYRGQRGQPGPELSFTTYT